MIEYYFIAMLVILFLLSQFTGHYHFHGGYKRAIIQTLATPIIALTLILNLVFFIMKFVGQKASISGPFTSLVDIWPGVEFMTHLRNEHLRIAESYVTLEEQAPTEELLREDIRENYHNRAEHLSRGESVLGLVIALMGFGIVAGIQIPKSSLILGTLSLTLVLTAGLQRSVVDQLVIQEPEKDASIERLQAQSAWNEVIGNGGAGYFHVLVYWLLYTTSEPGFQFWIHWNLFKGGRSTRTRAIAEAGLPLLIVVIAEPLGSSPKEFSHKIKSENIFSEYPFIDASSGEFRPPTREKS